MFTSKALTEHIGAFLNSLEHKGYHVTRTVLFGSYATGRPNELSDIDLALWLSNFPEKHYTDIPDLLKIVSSHHPIRPKFYSAADTTETDPFIEIIEGTGKEIELLQKNL